MLRQASVSDLVAGRVSAEKDYVVITMRRYPRFVARPLRQEYLSSMSPDKELFADWLSAKRRHNDHDGAFARARFEARFQIPETGWADLARLYAMARRRDVYLVCQCATGERCHREFLLILARRFFGAKVEKPRNAYPEFEQRVKRWKRKALKDR